jgi:hypothetical protein
MGYIGPPHRPTAGGRLVPTLRGAASLLVVGVLLMGCGPVEQPADDVLDPTAQEAPNDLQPNFPDEQPTTIPEQDAGPYMDPGSEEDGEGPDRQSDGRPPSGGDDPPDDATTIPEESAGPDADPGSEDEGEEPNSDGRSPGGSDDPPDDATTPPESRENAASGGRVAIALGGPRLGSPLLSPTDLFGDVPIGMPSPAAEIEFTNDLPVPQRISVSTDDLHLESDDCSGTSLAPADTCTVHLVATPDSDGPFIGVMRVDVTAECDPAADWHWCNWEPGETARIGDPIREDVSPDQWLLHYSTPPHPFRGNAVE